MPHAVSMPQTGFQALVLCGPGGSLNTFTTVPSEYPKALIPIANRPMVWYVLDWCYRMGVTNITLITPPESQLCLSAALAQNPYLTSLPSPSPNILAPSALTHETATAELLRLPEVQASITGDFMLLPCDLVCEVPGEIFLERWMSRLSSTTAVGATDGGSRISHGAKRRRQKGGLSVWYPTHNRAESVRDEECDFCATVTLDQQDVRQQQHDRHHQYYNPHNSNVTSLGSLRQLVLTLPFSTLNDKTETQGGWRVRTSLLRKYGAVKCLTQFRDAHVYFFPYWVKDFARWNGGDWKNRNQRHQKQEEEDEEEEEEEEEEKEGEEQEQEHKESSGRFDSVSEDLVGAWAMLGWRKEGFRRKFLGDEDGFGDKDGSGRRKSRSGGRDTKIQKDEGDGGMDSDDDDVDGSEPESSTPTTPVKGVLASAKRRLDDGGTSSIDIPIEEEIDVMSLSSTQVTRYSDAEDEGEEEPASSSQTATLASRVPVPNKPASQLKQTKNNQGSNGAGRPTTKFPPILSYMHSSDPSAPLIRRVDSTPLLLSVSLAIARLPALDDIENNNNNNTSSSSSSPLSHPTKIASTSPLPASTTISSKDSLIDHNALISSQTSLKACVIGSTCSIGTGTVIDRCVIMDGAVVGPDCELVGCVVGKKARVGKGCCLTGCEVQDGNLVADRVEAVGEKFLIGGLEDEGGDGGIDDGEGLEGEGGAEGEDMAMAI